MNRRKMKIRIKHVLIALVAIFLLWLIVAQAVAEARDTYGPWGTGVESDTWYSFRADDKTTCYVVVANGRDHQAAGPRGITCLRDS